MPVSHKTRTIRRCLPCSRSPKLMVVLEPPSSNIALPSAERAQCFTAYRLIHGYVPRSSTPTAATVIFGKDDHSAW